MSIEREPHSQNDFGSLQGCFVEGTAEQRAREHRIRRRALAISVAIQSAILAAIILFPLFGKPARIAFAMTPIPPYFPNTGPAHPPSDPRQPIRHDHHFFGDPISVPTSIPPYVFNGPVGEPQDPPDFPTGSGPGAPCPACIPIDDGRRQPERPAEVRPQTPHRLVMTHLESAMLIHRVEPVYPALAKQIHREGQVELHAIIATDGTIQSLQVVSGDALFLQSAVDAVSQWRYRATVLNGQPVEIDTYVTVIYTLQY
jgi:periplasmic protein TonB